MDKKREEAMKKAREFVIYQESEQADVNAKEKKFDAMWQSIYDVCKLVKYNIIDDITEDELDEACTWLKENQLLTEDYRDFIMEF